MKGTNVVNQVRPTARPAKATVDLQAIASLPETASTSADVDVYLQRAEVLAFAGLPDIFGDDAFAMAAGACSLEEFLRSRH